MTRFSISRDDAQKILNYLQERPFKDVFTLISILTNLEPEERVEDGEELHD